MQHNPAESLLPQGHVVPNEPLFHVSDFTCAVPSAWNVFFYILLGLPRGLIIFQDPAQDSLPLTYLNEVNSSFGPPLCLGYTFITCANQY